MIVVEVAAGELVSVFIRGRLVLQKWASAGTGGGARTFLGPGESIRELPTGVLYVTGDFPAGWRHSVPDGYVPGRRLLGSPAQRVLCP